MLEHARGLSPRALEAIADLERRVLDVDGGHLKLNWQVLESRSGEQVEDLLWWEDEQLVGFLGLYVFGLNPVELGGMVDPPARRRGIATALLDAALPLCEQRGHSAAMLVVPRSSTAGRCLALDRGAVLGRSHHTMVLLDAPVAGPSDPRIRLRRAGPQDAGEVGRLFGAAFGFPEAPDVSGLLASEPEDERTMLVEEAGLPIGVVRLGRHRDEGRVSGFGVDPGRQGRGIGRDVLRRVCRQLREDGARRVVLEVALDNDRALGLYTSVGFTPVATDDYYALAVAAPADRGTQQHGDRSA